ncbi:MAG TPA: glycoside hydrolase, partial [Pedobacter sp.]
MLRKNLLSLLIVLLSLSTQAQNKKAPEDPDNLAKDYFSQIMGVAVSATSNVKLYQFVYDWLGTPYRLG